MYGVPFAGMGIGNTIYRTSNDCTGQPYHPYSEGGDPDLWALTPRFFDPVSGSYRQYQLGDPVDIEAGSASSRLDTIDCVNSPQWFPTQQRVQALTAFGPTWEPPVLPLRFVVEE
jgi:hypothetical protein